MLIGVTGQIGSGKTTAAKILAKMGAAVINADLIGRKVVETNPVLIKKLAKYFGDEVVAKAGTLRRGKVAEIAFANPKNRNRLNRLVHPYLLKELRSEIKRLSKSNKVIVVDAALLLDWSFDRIVDQVLVIHSGLLRRLQRLQRRGIKRSDALARQKMQLSYHELRRRADKVILNNSSKMEFEKKVKDWGKQFFPTN